MTLNNQDLQLLEEFSQQMKNTQTQHTTNISNKGKIFLQKVKQNIKNNQEIILENSHNTTKNFNFAIEKDKSLGIDNNSNKKLIKGKYKIDYKLDLHGETLDSAYKKVHNLFKTSKEKDYKCLLIITGKGLHSKTGNTIKKSLEQWFKEPFFSDKIIKYVDANLKDGGSGAVYVLLRL